MSDPEIILHGTELSGHTHRVELLLRMLGLPFRFQAAPATVRGSREFQKLNPLRQIPVLQDGDLTLADSNAILVYLPNAMRRAVNGCQNSRSPPRRYSAGCRSQPAKSCMARRWHA
jgi:hypothetical protein